VNGLPEAIERVAGRLLPGVDRGPAAIASAVRALSDRYNGIESGPIDPDHRLAAELAFFVPADVGKIGVCLGELAAAGRIPARSPLRVLDLGAGCGTASIGARMALGDRAIEIVAVDREARSLEVARGLHDALGASAFRAVARDLSAGTLPAEGAFDLVLAQSLLCELPQAAREPLVRAALRTLSPDGVAIFVEPALRAAARSLHRVRDAILASGAARVFAPCVRQGPCPALDREADWCHEDRPWDPPESVLEIGRLAGLRRSGLKFAYVTLVPDRANVAGPDSRDAYRVVSDLMPSKGKSEAFLCGDLGRLRTIRLNRDRSEANAAFARMRRGDVLHIAGLDAGKPRVGRETAV